MTDIDRRMARIARDVQRALQADEQRDKAVDALSGKAVDPRQRSRETSLPATNPLGVHALHFRLG